MTARCIHARWYRYNQETLPQEQRETSRPTQFKVWHLIYNTEPAILTWDSAIHQGNFPLHVEALSSVQFVLRVLEHYHCALTLPVYLRDMPHLKSTYRSVCLQSCEPEINSLSKMDGSWSDMSSGGTWFCWWALYRKVSTHSWTQAGTIVVAGFYFVNPFLRWTL